MSVDMPRDHAAERARTRAAARRVVAPRELEALIGYAERRCDNGPVRDVTERSFVTETLEELADARNYLAWLGQRMHDEGRDDDRRAIAELNAATAQVAQAFDHVTRLGARLNDTGGQL